MKVKGKWILRILDQNDGEYDGPTWFARRVGLQKINAEEIKVTYLDKYTFENFSRMDKSRIHSQGCSWQIKLTEKNDFGDTGGELFGEWLIAEGTKRMFIGEGTIWGPHRFMTGPDVPFTIGTYHVDMYPVAGVRQQYVGRLPTSSVREAYELLSKHTELGHLIVTRKNLTEEEHNQKREDLFDRYLQAWCYHREARHRKEDWLASDKNIKVPLRYIKKEQNDTNKRYDQSQRRLAGSRTRP